MLYGENTSSEVERIGTAIVQCAFAVHKNLGPGLLESVYVICLMHELRKRGFKVMHETWLPILYDGVWIPKAYRVDLFVNDLVMFEAKAVEKMHPVFDAQMQTYLKLSDLNLGFLINFNVRLIKDGIKRVIYTKPELPQQIEDDETDIIE